MRLELKPNKTYRRRLIVTADDAAKTTTAAVYLRSKGTHTCLAWAIAHRRPYAGLSPETFELRYRQNNFPDDSICLWVGGAAFDVTPTEADLITEAFDDLGLVITHEPLRLTTAAPS